MIIDVFDPLSRGIVILQPGGHQNDNNMSPHRYCLMDHHIYLEGRDKPLPSSHKDYIS